MNWFWLAVTPPALWAICNYIDKFLLGKYLKVGGISTLLIYSSLIGLPVMLVILIFAPSVLSMGNFGKFVLMINGVVYVASFIPYYKALSRADTSVAIPIYQTAAVFSYFLGLLFLGEFLTARQIGAALLIILGAVGISLELAGSRVRIKHDVLLLMLLASFLYSVNSFIFKLVSQEESFWANIFWMNAGMASLGLLMLLVPVYRAQFIQLWKENRVLIVGANLANELINMGGDFAFKYALLLAPLALVTVASNGLQPFFVFMYGVVLTLFFPRLVKEEIGRKVLVQKVCAIILLFVGSYLLTNN